jgi:hypothetical protein
MSDRKTIKCDNCGKLLLVVVNGLCSDCRPAPSATVGDASKGGTIQGNETRHSGSYPDIDYSRKV